MKLETHANGFTSITIGEVEIIVPTTDDGGLYERIEIRGGRSRFFVQCDSVQLFRSEFENFARPGPGQ